MLSQRSYLCTASPNLFLKLVLEQRGLRLLFLFLPLVCFLFITCNTCYNPLHKGIHSSHGTSEELKANSPWTLFSFQFLTFSSFLLLWYSPEDSLLQQAPSHSKPFADSIYSISEVAMQGFALLLTHSSIPINPFPLPSSVETVWQHYSWCVNSQFRCQYLPSFSIHAYHLFHYPIHDTCTTAYYTCSQDIDDRS